jgi:hypothetical protein
LTDCFQEFDFPEMSMGYCFQVWTAQELFQDSYPEPAKRFLVSAKLSLVSAKRFPELAKPCRESNWQNRAFRSCQEFAIREFVRCPFVLCQRHHQQYFRCHLPHWRRPLLHRLGPSLE